VTTAPPTRRARLSEHDGLLRSDAATETIADDGLGDPAVEARATRTPPSTQPLPVLPLPVLPLSVLPLSVLPLHTPPEAARLLAVPESWLRRQVTARLVPHTRLGKHLRFSHADLVVIATTAPAPPGSPGRRAVPHRVADPAPPAGGEPDAAR
jgi:excisionase family DNA binding protein